MTYSPRKSKGRFRPATQVVAGVMLAPALLVDGFFVAYAAKLWGQGTNPVFAYWLQQSCLFQVLAFVLGILVPVPATWLLMRGVSGRAGRWVAVGLAGCITIVALRSHAEFLWTTAFGCYDSDVEALPLSLINDTLARLLGENVQVPPTARDVHFISIPPIDPGVILKFTAGDDEAQHFAAAVRRRLGLDDASDGTIPEWAKSAQVRPWWTPRDTLPVSVGPLSFLQVDRENGTVYLYCVLK